MAGQVKGVTDFLGVKPAYAEMGSEAIGRAAQEFSKVTQGNALAANAGMKAQADIQSAQHYADAGVAAGAAAGQASMVGGIAGGLGGLASGFSKAGKGLSPVMQQASINAGGMFASMVPGVG